MKWWATFVLIVFSALWIGGSLTFGLEAMIPSDCSYMNTEDCRARQRFGRELLFWRTAAIELGAIACYIWLIRKK